MSEQSRKKLKEFAYAVTKGSIGAVPVAGGVLSELFGLLVTDPSSRRREKILAEIDRRLNYMENRGFDIRTLANNDEFLSIVLQAYNIALRTHQEEKHAALLNAISNTPLSPLEDNIKQMFLMYIDQFSEWHLRILAFLDNPADYFGANKPSYTMAGRGTIMTQAFPELNTKRAFYDQVVKDLASRGLIVIDTLHVTVTEQGLWQSTTSKFGKDFLAYIKG